MLFLTKVAGVASITAALTLGVMTTYNGATTIQQAKDTITNQIQKLNIFESNENKLVTKIGALKTQITSLETQVASMVPGTEKDALLAQIVDLNSQISSLQAQLGVAETNGETLATRIDALEVELQKANADVATLQTTLNNSTTTANPLTDLELAQLGVGPEVINLTYTKGVSQTLTLTEGVTFYFTSPYYKITNSTGSNITYTIEGSGTTVTKGQGIWTIEGISGSSTNVFVTTVINGKTYRITVISN